MSEGHDGVALRARMSLEATERTVGSYWTIGFDVGICRPAGHGEISDAGALSSGSYMGSSRAVAYFAIFFCMIPLGFDFFGLDQSSVGRHDARIVWLVCASSADDVLRPLLRSQQKISAEPAGNGCVMNHDS